VASAAGTYTMTVNLNTGYVTLASASTNPTTLWTGSQSFSWGTMLNVTSGSNYQFAEGDIVTLNLSYGGTGNEQVQLRGGTSSSNQVLDGSKNGSNDYFDVSNSASSITFTLSSADAALLNASGNDLFVDGQNLTLTSVKIARPIALLSTEYSSGSWSGTSIELPSAVKSSMAAGDMIIVTLTTGGQLQMGYGTSSAYTGSLSATGDYTNVSSGSFTAILTSDDVTNLTGTNGGYLYLNGSNIVVSKVVYVPNN
jgi:small nuclear ribonucleoprotein (snRNP)-like protein